MVRNARERKKRNFGFGRNAFEDSRNNVYFCMASLDLVLIRISAVLTSTVFAAAAICVFAPAKRNLIDVQKCRRRSVHVTLVFFYSDAVSFISRIPPQS